MVAALLLALAAPRLVHASASEPRFAQADQAFRERGDAARAREALRLYRQLYQATPDDPEAGWRLGFACYFVGIRLTPDGGERKKLYAEGRDAAAHAAQLDDACAACHFWAAINMVLWGQEVGPFRTFFLLPKAKQQLRASLAHDPGYAYGGAYRLLGQIDQFLPRLLGGNKKRARGFYEQAIQASPGEPLNYLFLARLLEDLKEKDAALRIAKKGLAVATPTPERLEALDALKDLRKFVAEHGG